MYECYLEGSPTGVQDVEVQPTPDGLEVTVTFSVTTDTLAWITVDANGRVSPGFGGTGTSSDELDRYAEYTVRIWRTITGDEETAPRYALPGKRKAAGGRPTIIDA